MINATCTWGEGPDVLLVLKDHHFVLYENPTFGGYTHGVVTKGSTDLTVDEAESLAHDLLNAVAQCRELDASAEQANLAMDNGVDFHIIDNSAKCVECDLFSPYADNKSPDECIQMVKERKIGRLKENCGRWLCNDNACPHYNRLTDKQSQPKSEPHTITQQELHGAVKISTVTPDGMVKQETLYGTVDKHTCTGSAVCGVDGDNRKCKC